MRLAHLSPEARRLAALAATIGRSFTFAILRQASGEDDDRLVAALDELWRRRIVREARRKSRNIGIDVITHIPGEPERTVTTESTFLAAADATLAAIGGTLALSAAKGTSTTTTTTTTLAAMPSFTPERITLSSLPTSREPTHGPNASGG